MSAQQQSRFAASFRLVIESCSAAWQHFRQAFPAILLSPLFELLFFLVIGFATAPIFERIVVYAQAYFSSLAPQAPAITQNLLQGGGISAGSSQLLMPLLLIYLVLLLTTYLIYTLFEGLVWAFAARAVAPQPLGHYLRKFALANLLWVPLYGIFHLLTLLVGFQQLVSESMELSPPRTVPLITFLFALLLAYFAFTDYALLRVSSHNIWRRMKTAARISIPLLPLVVFLLLLFYAIDILLQWVFTFSHATFALVVSALIVLPLFTYFRLVWLVAVAGAVKHNFK